MEYMVAEFLHFKQPPAPTTVLYFMLWLLNVLQLHTLKVLQDNDIIFAVNSHIFHSH